MANFNAASKWLKEGKKVTRPCWREDSYWVLGVDEIIFWKCEHIAVPETATVHLNQLTAKDWKVFSEKALENRDLRLTIRKLIKEEIDNLDRYL